MLKRSRASSPSPTRADPSSPPPLVNPLLPRPKRRRTIGPVIDSYERRDCSTADDGEDDYEEDYLEGGGDDTSISEVNGKVYEHVNHFLHNLHTEHQHRSRTAQSHAGPSYGHFPGVISFASTRGSPPSWSSPSSSPDKYGRGSAPTSSMSSMKCRDTGNSLENEDDISRDSDGAHNMERTIPRKTYASTADVQDDERTHVMHRYEDMNRLLGSVVLDRRRTLGSPSLDSHSKGKSHQL